MRSRQLEASLLLVGCAVAAACWKAGPVHGASAASTVSSTAASTPNAAGWNRQAAASYMDQREVWWQQWPHSQRDHGTICISCHTVVPYAMSRPALRRELGEGVMTATEKTMMDSVEKRVGHWSEMAPFYSDANSGPNKTAESHSTEAVLNAVVLASVDARQGRLRPITRAAFDAAWALQLASGDNAGGWLWQDFHLAPWESGQSAYQGAALLAVQVGNAPGGYADQPETRPHVQRLRDYLRRQYAAQPLANQLYVLWASPKLPGLLAAAEGTALLQQIEQLQQPDGGWRLASLGEWKRSDDSLEPADSDGYATALVVLAMEESGTPSRDPSLNRGLAWLESHQQKDGNWTAASLNKQRDPATDIGRFMNDAATGYAVLALENSR